MSKKGNKKTANKSLETLKRKQYARGGRRGNPPARKAAQPVQELKQIKAAPQLTKAIPKQKVSDPAPKPAQEVKQIEWASQPIDSSLFSDPVKAGGGGIKNPKDIKLPEPSRIAGGGKGQATEGSGGPINESLNLSRESLAENVMQPLGNQRGGSLEKIAQPLADIYSGGNSSGYQLQQARGNQQSGIAPVFDENVQARIAASRSEQLKAENEQDRLGQDVLERNQQFNDNVMNSTEYQEALSALQSSGGKDEEAKAELQKL